MIVECSYWVDRDAGSEINFSDAVVTARSPPESKTLIRISQATLDLR